MYWMLPTPHCSLPPPGCPYWPEMRRQVASLVVSAPPFSQLAFVSVTRSGRARHQPGQSVASDRRRWRRLAAGVMKATLANSASRCV